MAREIRYNNLEVSLVVFIPKYQYKSCYYLYKQYSVEEMWRLFQLIVSLLLLISMLVSNPTRAEAFLGFCFTSKTRGKKGACSRTPAGFLI